MKKNRINEIWGVLFLLLGLFTLAALFFYHPEDLSFYTSHPASPVQNYTGVAGAYLSFGLLLAFGISAYLIPALFLLWSVCFFAQNVPERKFFKFLGLGMALCATATMVAVSLEPAHRFVQGGALGYVAGTYLLNYFGMVGSYILAGSCLLLSLLLATDFLLYPLVMKTIKRSQKMLKIVSAITTPVLEMCAALGDALQRRPRRKMVIAEPLKTNNNKKAAAPVKETGLEHLPLKVKQYDPTVSATAEKLKAEAAQEAAKRSANAEKPKKSAKLVYKPENFGAKPEGVAAQAGGNGSKPAEAKAGSAASFEGVVGSKVSIPFIRPSIDLLNKPSAALKQMDDLKGNSRILEQTLAEFGISVKVIEVEQGPVITRYELLPAPGVKVNSISALQDDLALALKAASVRLIIPIPGKSAVGVEVPNSVSNIVTLREMIESHEFQTQKAHLPLVLGKTANGEPMIFDLTKMPHILIAGSTGSGKTVCVNAIIMGLLYHTTPEDLKFVMVDPKMVELSQYNEMPHMLTPVVTDVRKAAHTLNWVVNEMENRYRLFAACGVRNIESFNTREISEEGRAEMEAAADSEHVVPVKLPYIVVVIDELADLMLVARDKVEGVILRLAQLARAVGIHLILATQRPSVDVITGVIKANFPARLSFKVSSKVDSRTVLDVSGADKLIGRGDLLFLQPGDPKPVRGQAPMVSDEEINRVVKFVAEQARPEFRPEILKAQEGRTSEGSGGEKDELFEEAVRVVLETRQASTSNLQRRLRLGYTRAARIIDQMEAEGIVGPQQGAKPREIYMQPEDAQPVESQDSV